MRSAPCPTSAPPAAPSSHFSLTSHLPSSSTTDAMPYGAMPPSACRALKARAPSEARAGSEKSLPRTDSSLIFCRIRSPGNHVQPQSPRIITGVPSRSCLAEREPELFCRLCSSWTRVRLPSVAARRRIRAAQLGLLQRLLLQEPAGRALQHVAALPQDVDRALQGASSTMRAHLVVDRVAGFLAVVALARRRSGMSGRPGRSGCRAHRRRCRASRTCRSARPSRGRCR